MKYFLNGILGSLTSLLLIKAGVDPLSWYFWAIFGLILMTTAVQYIDR